MQSARTGSRKRGAARNDEGPSSPRQVKIAKGTHPFFLKPSEKPPNAFVWKKSIEYTCLHGVNLEPIHSGKVAAWDLDGTLIKTRSGGKYPRDKDDWMWWRASVKRKITEMHEEGYAIVIFSNQASSKKKTVDEWKLKISSIANELSNVPFRIFAAQQHDAFRKPMLRMWTEFEMINQREIDKNSSFFVGDAAGRPGDHSDTDRKWALNIGLPFFTPEEYFLGSEPTLYKLKGFNASSFPDDWPLFTPSSSPLIPKLPTTEVILFVGYPASGKSSFYRRYFQAAGYEHVNQDILKTRNKCVQTVEKNLKEGKSCVVDNTNRDMQTRKEYVDLCRKHNVLIRCMHFSADIQLCWHNNLYRAFSQPPKQSKEFQPVRILLPQMAFTSFRANYEEPTIDEGFGEIKRINFRFEGNEEERRRWNMWLEIDNRAWLTSTT